MKFHSMKSVPFPETAKREFKSCLVSGQEVIAWAELWIRAIPFPLTVCHKSVFRAFDSIAGMFNPSVCLAFPLDARKSKQMLSSPS